jgi:hypothetical protein
VALTARAPRLPRGRTAALGTITLTSIDGRLLGRVPWSLLLGPGAARLVAGVHLSTTRFRPSDTRPAVLSFEAGAVGEGDAVVPVARLDVELWSGDGRHRFGLLSTLHDLLPGRYAFGLTGRGPGGGRLGRGRWLLRLVATPTGGGRPTIETLRFTIE